MSSRSEGAALPIRADGAVSHTRADGAVAAVPGGINSDQLLESQEPVTELTLADGVALVRQVLAEATVPPRWPMYLRQMKQFLRNARPDFDERRYGSLQDLLRACQKVGLVRLERDRQGGLRAFAGAVKPYMPQGWVAPETETAADVQEASSAAVDAMVVTEGDVTATSSLSSDVIMSYEPPANGAVGGPNGSPVDEGRVVESHVVDEAEGDDQLAMFGVVRPTDPEPVKAKRVVTTPRRPRKNADAPKRVRKVAAPRGARRGTKN